MEQTVYSPAASGCNCDITGAHREDTFHRAHNSRGRKTGQRERNRLLRNTSKLQIAQSETVANPQIHKHTRARCRAAAQHAETEVIDDVLTDGSMCARELRINQQ